MTVSAVSLEIFVSPQPKGGGTYCFGADPVGVGVALFPHIIF